MKVITGIDERTCKRFLYFKERIGPAERAFWVQFPYDDDRQEWQRVAEAIERGLNQLRAI